MSDRDAYQAAADDGAALRRRLSSAAGIPTTTAAHAPDALPSMSTALDRLHAARRDTGMPDLDDNEGLALGVRLAREARDEIAAAIDRR